MLDRMRRNHCSEDNAFEELEGELRAAGLMAPTPQPTAERRAELRTAVIAQRTERSRAGVGGFRGAALGVAMVAGGGLVIASAAGGGNPVTFVAEVVRDIPAPESPPGPGEQPAETPPVVAMTPDASPTHQVQVAAGSTPTPPVRAIAAEAAATSVRDIAVPPAAATPTSRNSDADAKGSDTVPPLSAAIPTNTARPAASSTSNAGPALADVKPTTTRTSTATVSPTSTPKPAVDPASVTTTSASPTGTATPVPTRPKPISTSKEPLTADEVEANTANQLDSAWNSRD